MRLLVLGAGGIGGYFGGRLVQAGANVTFLVRPARRQQLVRDGLCIQSALGDLQVPVHTVVAADLRPEYQLVLLTCKAYDLEAAMDAIAPAMDGTCAVVPMLNGLAHLDRLAERFGPRQVMGGTCMIDVTLRRDGVIHHSGTLQRLIFGERDRTTSARARTFADTLAKTTITWELSSDIDRNLWEKLVFLSALAAMTCLFRANVREIMAAPGGREAMERALGTNIEIATCEGYPPSEAAVAFARDRLTDPTGPWSASMLRDLEAGGSVESEHIVGWMLHKARAHQLDDTMLALSYTHLKAYEARRDAGRLPENPPRAG
jgi:2-dehydropantoate 2-reductase